MTGYEAAYAAFDWERVWDDFDWDAPDELNLAHETVRRHAGEGVAIYWEGAGDEREALTYGDLDERSAAVANALADAGVGRGDRVATLVPRIPELYATFLGIWRLGAVYVPLFTAFGPKAIEARAGDAGVETVVTTRGYRGTLAAVEDALDLRTTVVVDHGHGELRDGDVPFEDFLEGHSTEHAVARTSADDLAILEYTSGTTGPPKGCRLTHRVLGALYPYLEYSMDLREDAVVWGAADPGWMYGLLTAGIAPISYGVPNVVYEGEFDPAAWYGVMERCGVTDLASSPTAYRGLVNAGDAHESYDLELARGSSAGEPLNPEVIRWFDEELGVPVRDHYGVTECGMVAGTHHAVEMPLRPGSMGRPLPGFRVRVLADGDRADVDEVGELAVRRGGGTYFEGYLGRPEQSTAAWVDHDGGEWFATGDAVYRDEDEYLWFVGRADDVIVTSGYRVGPFEVESTLIEHEGVAEAAVIGVPDERRGERVKAFVVPAAGADDTPAAADEIRSFVRERLAKHAYPREVEFVERLPKTESGKIRRIELREREDVEDR